MDDCSVRDEDLIAYDDGYLDGARRELVEAHLRDCPSCQQRLTAFREVDEILRRTAPSVDIRRSREAVHRRLDALDAEKNGRSFWRLLTPLAAVTGLCLLVLLVWPMASGADSVFGSFVRFGEVQVRRIPGIPDEGVPVKHVATPASDASLSFDGVEPAELPLDLVQVERSIPASDRLELLYRNQDGLAILLSQVPANPETLTVDPSTASYVVSVDGTSVLVLADPRPDAVAAVFWEQDGIAFGLFVTASWGGLVLDDAMPIVAAIVAAGDLEERR